MHSNSVKQLTIKRNEVIKVYRTYIYLGILVSDNGEQTEEIAQKIEYATKGNNKVFTMPSLIV